MKAKKITGFAVASAAAAMFAGAPMIATGASHGGNVQCMGVNACKGTSSCKTANSACKGQNSCKGTGFVSVSKEVCDQLGGKAAKG